MSCPDKRKNILYVESNIDGTVGGSHFSLLYLVEGLNKYLYSPVVLFYQKNPMIPRYVQVGARVLLFKKTRSLNVMERFPFIKKWHNNKIASILFVVPLIVIQKIFNLFITFLFPSVRCWRIIQREKIDLIHLNNTLLKPQEWILASLLTKARIIAHERGINKSFPFHVRFGARFLKVIICISKAVENNLINNGFPQEKLTMIYNGLDPDTFNITKSKADMLQEFSISGDSPVVGIVGNIKQWKGQDIVVKAMNYVLKEVPGTKCMLIGGVSDSDRGYLSMIQKLVTEENLNDCIIYTGKRNDVPDIINSLSVLIHASTLPEPFGRVLLEGMALEKPVITTNIGAGPEIVEDGKTGIIVPPEDEKSLAKAILSLLKDPEKSFEMGKEGRLRLEKHFHVSENIRKTEELYSNVIT